MFKVDKEKPSLIVIDGLKGSGKTTVANSLYNFCNELNKDVVLFYSESTKLSSKLDEFVEQNKNIDTYSQFLLEEANRNQHIKNYINPCLEKGKDVICDQFSLSTIVYKSDVLNVDYMTSIDRGIISKLLPCNFCQVILDCKDSEANRRGNYGLEEDDKFNSQFIRLCDIITLNNIVVNAENPTDRVTLKVKEKLGKYD